MSPTIYALGPNQRNDPAICGNSGEKQRQEEGNYFGFSNHSIIDALPEQRLNRMAETGTEKPTS
jgi:hypothetical protein